MPHDYLQLLITYSYRRLLRSTHGHSDTHSEKFVLSQDMIEMQAGHSKFRRISLNSIPYVVIKEDGIEVEARGGSDKEQQHHVLQRRDLDSLNATDSDQGEGDVFERKRKESKKRRLPVDYPIVPHEDMWMLTRAEIEQQQQRGCLFATAPPAAR